ncbi:MAG TPA: hypothetical protein VGB24_02885 [Longimicrobium sp.]|jgi:hypothetical protein|uniref:hypothetical protein n=1 Tax=Longimicrobium sp. TaxID=2029185 RepID=UPI002EDA63CD
MKPISRIAVLLTLAITPAVAQGQAKINGYGDLNWGATRDAVTRYWRETPAAENTERGMAFMQFKDWQGLQWIVAAHQQQGFSHFRATSVPTLAAADCPRVFGRHVAALTRSYSPVAAQGGVNNPGGGNLCDEVRAGRATARYTWADPVNNAAATLYIDPANGRIVYTAETPFFREWLAQRGQPAAQSAPQPAPAPAAAPVPAAPTGYDSRLWRPSDQPVRQLPFGASRADIQRTFGEPLLARSDDVSPGMIELLYSRDEGGLVFTVHQTKGLIRVVNSTGFMGPDEPCNAFWERMRARVAAMFPGVTPQGGAHNPAGGDLCEQVKAGRAFAETAWPTADGGSVWLRIGPSTGAISVAVSTPDYHRWFDATADGRERADRLRRASGAAARQ